MLAVAEAGVYDLTRQIDYDENTIFQSVRRIHDIGRARQHRPATGGDALQRPFFMFVSLSHTSDPYLTTQEYWDRYNHDEIDMPKVIPDADDDSEGLQQLCFLLPTTIEMTDVVPFGCAC